MGFLGFFGFLGIPGFLKFLWSLEFLGSYYSTSVQRGEDLRGNHDEAVWRGADRGGGG